MDRTLSEVKVVENFLKPTNDNKPQIKKKIYVNPKYNQK